MRIIAHLDMDAFFAAVEERNNPRFRGLPIVVGSDPKGGEGRGIVSTANYKAHEAGIHSGQAISKAWKLSAPDTVWLSGSWSSYSKVSKSIMGILQSNVATMQQAGADEAYFDLGFAGSFPDAKKIALNIQQQVFNKEKITCSIGIGPNKLVAKIASDYQKPNGLTVEEPDQVTGFLEDLPIRAIPGIGPKTEIKLNSLGVKTVAQAWELSPDQISHLYNTVRGIDNRPLSEPRVAKSIGHEETFMADSESYQEIMNTLLRTCEKSHQRLFDDGFKNWQTTTVTLRLSDFSRHTHSFTSKKRLNNLRDLKQVAMRLALPFFDHRKNPRQQAVRLIGVRLTKISYVYSLTSTPFQKATWSLMLAAASDGSG